MYFSNDNIDTKEEFEKRLAAAKVLAAAEGLPIVVKPYDHESWLREVAAGYEPCPEKGERCLRCFQYQLRHAAAECAARGLDAYTTTLTVSPHKVSAKVFAAARSARGSDPTEVGRDPRGTPPQFLEIDFKKKEGFKVSLKRAAELGLYRQGYCGCEFSKARTGMSATLGEAGQ